MFNSSSTTRSKVTICFAAGSVNLGHILKYADEYNLMGKGFVWILASATVNLESAMENVIGIDHGHFRRLCSGVLNFDAVLLPDYIHMAVAQSGVCVCVCVRVCVCIIEANLSRAASRSRGVCVCVCVRVCVCVHIHVCVCTYTHARTQTHTHTHTHTCTRTRAHTHKSGYICVLHMYIYVRLRHDAVQRTLPIERRIFGS
jgi:hypothetical protein